MAGVSRGEDDGPPLRSGGLSLFFIGAGFMVRGPDVGRSWFLNAPAVGIIIAFPKERRGP